MIPGMLLVVALLSAGRADELPHWPSQYVFYPRKCIGGHNIELISDVPLEECAAWCLARADCLGFEYGVDYSGAVYEPRDCSLQSNGDAEVDTCGGSAHNLDFYKKTLPPTGYIHFPGTCVSGHNFALISDMSLDECAAWCNAREECLAFEFYVHYGGNSGDSKDGDCHLQGSDVVGTCDGFDRNLDLWVKTSPLIGYSHSPGRCVNGNNLELISERSPSECAALCSSRADCLAFEYGVLYRTSSHTSNDVPPNYQAHDCQLQSSADISDCDGYAYNLDIFIKESASGGTIGNEDESASGGTIGNESSSASGGTIGNEDESASASGENIANESASASGGNIANESASASGGTVGNEEDSASGGTMVDEDEVEIVPCASHQWFEARTGQCSDCPEGLEPTEDQLGCQEEMVGGFTELELVAIGVSSSIACACLSVVVGVVALRASKTSE